MIADREFVKTLPDDELLESQRAVFALSDMPIPIMGLGTESTHLLGEVVAYDLSLAISERYGNSSDYLRRFAQIAHRLISYDPQKAIFGGENSDFINVKANVFESLGDWAGGWVYTPEGFVKKIDGDLKQKVVQFQITDDSRYAGDEGRFNFSSRPVIRLYTDNLVATSPLWEYRESSGSDILPGSIQRPHFFHLPQGFADQELALSVVQSLARVVDAADRY